MRKQRPDWNVTVIDKLGYAGDASTLEPILDEIKFVAGDICDEALIDELVSENDLVVHFAAESHNDNSLESPWEFVESNIIGTYRILQAVRKHSKKMHHISTDEVYGDTPIDSDYRFNETTRYSPSSPYSSTKAASDSRASAAGLAAADSLLWALQAVTDPSATHRVNRRIERIGAFMD